MENLRTLRRSRSLTFLDLAALTGIPARHLAEIEHGLRHLTPPERETLALILGLEPHAFTGAHRRLSPAAQAPALALPLPGMPPAFVDQRAAQALLVAALAATVAAGSLSAARVPLPSLSLPTWGLAARPTTAPLVGAAVTQPVAAPLVRDTIARPTAAPVESTGEAQAGAAPTRRSLPDSAKDRLVPSSTPGAASPVPISLDPRPVAGAAVATERSLAGLSSLARRPRQDEAIAPTLVSGPTPGEEVAPAPLPAIETAPAFTLTEAGPMGCPVKPAAGRVVMTQGYGVGTHAPAEIWGAVDLAVDGDGDGYAEVGASWYAPILATHDGYVTVSLDTYPAGNHVWVDEPGGVWRSGYSHLAIVTVISGQFVRAGEQIGLLGNSGMSSGPHLDYQVWHAGVNIDPTWLVGCS